MGINLARVSCQREMRTKTRKRGGLTNTPDPLVSIFPVKDVTPVTLSWFGEWATIKIGVPNRRHSNESNGFPYDG